MRLANVKSVQSLLIGSQVDYEVTGDTTCASNVPQRARMAKLRKVINQLIH